MHQTITRLSNKIKVELFYDVISPYAWIAFEALTRYNKKFSNMILCLQPVLMGGIVQGIGKLPVLPPAKKKYELDDLQRLTKYYGMTLNYPKNLREVLFTKGTLPSQRLLTAVKLKCPEYLQGISRELFLRIWTKDVDAVSRTSLAAACKDAGLSQSEIDCLLALSQSDEVKQALKTTTHSALDYGAFGLPTYVAHLNSEPSLFFWL